MFTNSPKPKKILGVLGPRVFDFFHFFFRIFASVRLAIPILVSLIIILAAGTIIESLHGADAAKILIYDTVWFAAVLFLLGMNVFTAAIDRIPWKLKHIGFLITHLGIILILVGSFITKATMIDGQMPVAEGETAAHITLFEPIVYVFSEDVNADWIYAIPQKPFAWEGREKVSPSEKADHEFYLLHYYPKARLNQSLQPAEEGPAAVRVKLKNSFLEQEHWLVEKDEKMSKVALGPAEIVFAQELLKEAAAPAPDDRGYLEIKLAEGSVRIPVPAADTLPFTSPVEGTPLQVTITRVLNNALVEGEKLIDKPEEGTLPGGPGRNPAVELTLEGSGPSLNELGTEKSPELDAPGSGPSLNEPGTEKSPELDAPGSGLQEFHTVFARFPEFPTQHGMKPSAAGLSIFYILPGTGPVDQTNELRFVRQADGLAYQVKTGALVKTGKAVPKEPVQTGWNDLAFTVEEYLPHSRFNKTFDPQPNISQAEDLVSAAEVEIVKGKESRRLWLAQGLRDEVTLGGASYHLIFGQRRIPLGFKIELKDFKIENNPGTDQPARFSSDVVLKDDKQGLTRDVHITMNEPLEYQGFKLYQSAYSIEPGRPEISIFSVGRDPGVPVKYAGAIVLITGTITIFSQRKFRKRTPE